MLTRKIDNACNLVAKLGLAKLLSIKIFIAIEVSLTISPLVDENNRKRRWICDKNTSKNQISHSLLVILEFNENLYTYFTKV